MTTSMLSEYDAPLPNGPDRRTAPSTGSPASGTELRERTIASYQIAPSPMPAPAFATLHLTRTGWPDLPDTGEAIEVSWRSGEGESNTETGDAVFAILFGRNPSDDRFPLSIDAKTKYDPEIPLGSVRLRSRV